MKTKTETVIGICGGSASGKTTICYDLAEHLQGDVQIISQDSYYFDRSGLSANEIKEINFDSPDSVDLAQLYEDLARIKAGNEVAIPQYCFETHARRKEKTIIKNTRIILLEGLFIFENESLRNLIDHKIYITADDDIRLLRRIKRDIVERGRDLDAVLDQYLNMVKPMHTQHIASKEIHADYVVDTSDNLSPEEIRRTLLSIFDLA